MIAMAARLTCSYASICFRVLLVRPTRFAISFVPLALTARPRDVRIFPESPLSKVSAR